MTRENNEESFRSLYVKHIGKVERGISDDELRKDLKARLRQHIKEGLEGDLQLDGFILLGWMQGEFASWNKKRGWIRAPGMAAYLPKSGSRWVYFWKTHGKYAPHPNPVWGNRRWTHFVETLDKPKRLAIEKILSLLAAPKPPYDRANLQNGVWMPSVPLWLLDNKKDMRPLYLAGGKPK